MSPLTDHYTHEEGTSTYECNAKAKLNIDCKVKYPKKGGSNPKTALSAINVHFISKHYQTMVNRGLMLDCPEDGCDLKFDTQEEFDKHTQYWHKKIESKFLNLHIFYKIYLLFLF